MIPTRRFLWGALWFLCSLCLADNVSLPSNRLTYLDESDPFYVGRDFPKWTTPQWVGEDGVEAVVILAIDDMRDPQRYADHLRPIVERLKKIDGRAPVSIFCNAIDPEKPQLQQFLKDGLSLEVHTLSHPCPLLAQSNFVASANTYFGCIDLLNRIPGNQPMAFRMPCCDSMNSPSPRFYAELFNQTNQAGQFLTIDSSVMNITTAKDPTIPKEWVTDANGNEKFRKYLPFKSFVTTIEDYPYPYVIGKLCWEFPAMVPSDWEAQNIQGTNNPVTVADWKTALDVTVKKQGTFTFIFHPHGWIRPDQLVEFIDYAVERYGKKVKFLNFHEAQDRLNKSLGQPLRAANGQDNGVRLVDLNADGYLDVLIGNDQVRRSRVWNPNQKVWQDSAFPTALVKADASGQRRETGVRFGILDSSGYPAMLVHNEEVTGAWRYDGKQWVAAPGLNKGLALSAGTIWTQKDGHDRGVRFRDVDRDGTCELMVANESQNAIFAWSSEEKGWKTLPYALPSEVALVDANGRDQGLRFADINEDGFEDLIFSNGESFGTYLFTAKAVPHLSWQVGWSQKVRSGKRGDAGQIPMIVRGGEHPNNGAWFHSGHLWVQNEDTAHLADKVDRRSFQQLMSFDSPPAKSPEESLKTIRVRPGLTVELVANEPLIEDPVAFEWGADGKLWVVEMIDYPIGLDNNGKPGGVVKYLEDRDGDGRYDHATVFLDGLNFPNGIMPWRKGVLVSAAPEVFYAEDTDGDGKADLKKVLFEGFGQGNQQHRVNGFDYGLDNWVYAANGESGGNIHALLTDQRINIRGRDLRFRPDTGFFEAIAGSTQFGRHRDDWGNWFGNNNPAWLWHYYLPDQYLVRNQYLAVNGTKRYLANYANSTRAYAISKPMQRFNWPDMVNTVTSANSATPYRDELFGPEFATSVFASEPANNLMHREVLEEDGVSFKSHRAAGEEDKEFVASTDNWFRPTMIKTGPDGALYFADMYRLVIEHIEYGLPGMEKQIDLRAGADKGRIYRIYPAGATLRKIPRLDQLDTPSLVQAMETVNGWQRDTAQRLLVHAGDKTAVPSLENLFSKNANPKVRLQALCTLEGLNSITSRNLLTALQDQHPSVREHAVQMAEPFLRATSENKSNADAVSLNELTSRLLSLVDDPSIRVRYQLAFTLGEWKDQAAARALIKLAKKDKEDASVRNAILSSSTPHVSAMLSHLFEQENPGSVSEAFVDQLVGLAVLMKKNEALTKPLQAAGRIQAGHVEQWQTAALAGLLNALDRRNQTLEQFAGESSGELRRSIQGLDGLFGHARTVAFQSGASEEERLSAVRLLGRGLSEQSEDIDRLGKLLEPQHSSAIQKTALAALGRSKNANTPDALLRGWKSHGPSLRTEVLNIITSRTEWIGKLLDAVEQSTIPGSQISPVVRQKLLTSGQTGVRNRAQQLFSHQQDRKQVLKEFQKVLELQGDSKRGAALFRQNCALCHRLRGEGTLLGPELTTFGGKPAELLLLDILDPNQAVEAPYVSYTVVTASDRELTGIIASESPNSITLRSAGGTDETILRSELKQLTSAGLSLMPEGFDKVFSPQDLADLIHYITVPAAP